MSVQRTVVLRKSLVHSWFRAIPWKGAPCAAALAWLALSFAMPAAAAPLKAEDIIRTHSCMGCHRIPGIPEAVGTIGPPLKDLSSRRRIAGGKLTNSPENLARWLKNPKDVMTTMMPNTGLTDEEVDVLVKFLLTL